MPQLGAIAVGGMAAGTALQAVGGIQSMNTADRVAGYNADAMQRQAQAERLAASYSASQIMQRADSTAGTQKAIQAASGVDTSTGSPALVRAKSYDEALQDALAVLYRGQTAAQATAQQGKVINAMRPANKLGLLLGIGGTLLQGGAQTALTAKGFA